ncbi:MAG TPA: adenylate/guanylate cyclase domain-containing protein [Candidatus Limnocylindria bacterium]|nr:adenylate/guanylate cyclase domain-containing protein [Candidatus Limnocylindria bacterium]
MGQVADASPLERGREALAHHAWGEAYDLLSAADAEGGLGAAELGLLAEAAWWVGKLPVAIEARERAYAAAIKAGDLEIAVEAAVRLVQYNIFRNALTVANAWILRADRLLEGREEHPGHGWLAVMKSLHAAIVGDGETMLAESERAIAIARRFGDRNLEALALSGRGAALVSAGQVAEGLALVDEATVAAVSGELDPGVAGGVCCTTIEACTALGAWERAAEWTEAQDRWCRREGISGYPGMCRVFRSEIKRRRGSWLEAEAEAQRASVELEGFVPAAVGTALYQIAEIRLRRGDLASTEEILLRAHSLGTDPEPALSLLRLAQGRTDAAMTGIRRALDAPIKAPSWRAPPDSGVHRLPLLEAQVEIALAAGDLPAARAAADELGSLAGQYGTDSFRAPAAWAVGAVRVAAGEPVAGIPELRRAIDLAHDTPYEAAASRLILAEALAMTGDADSAAVEARTARGVFERLGATPDVRRSDRLLATVEAGEAAATGAPAERVTKAFMFTDIVDSTRFAELLGDEAWQRLLRWHDEALRAVVAEHGGEEIKATGDGFFLAFDDPDRAIDAAIAIQRRLAAQREAQGFAPAVRIGVHRAEAGRSGLDYLGIGVNQAARVGAAASGGEILVTASMLEASRRASVQTDRRTLELKGLSAPVEVAVVDWR